MIDAVSVPATGMAPLILGVSALGKNGVRDTPQARTAACVIAVAMARRLVLALAENDPAVDPTSLHAVTRDRLEAVFSGCSLSEPWDRFLFDQLRRDRTAGSTFGIEPGLTNWYLTSLIRGSAIPVPPNEPLSDPNEAVGQGFNLGHPNFALALLGAERETYEMWRRLSALS